MGGRSKPTRILCINCNICVNTLRRYRASELDSRLIKLLYSWVYPLIITDEAYVCEACRDLAVDRVNENLQQEDSGSNEQQAGPNQQGHMNVCLLCGCSISRRQRDKILRDNPSELQQSMINIIGISIAPKQELEPTVNVSVQRLSDQVRAIRRCNLLDSSVLEKLRSDLQTSLTTSPPSQPVSHQDLEVLQASPVDGGEEFNASSIAESDCVCHPCWLRTQRAARRMSHVDDARLFPDSSNITIEESTESREYPQRVQKQSIVLPNYRRAANTNNHCVFPNCSSTTFHGVPDKLRANILKNHHYYIPRLARVCAEHLRNNSWETLFKSENSIETFTAEQIQHVFSFLNAFSPAKVIK